MHSSSSHDEGFLHQGHGGSSNSTMKEDDEHTSLLAATSAAAGAAPRNPHRLSLSRQDIQIIEQISQNAHRLAQEVNDTDSINGLLDDDYDHSKTDDDDDYSVGASFVDMLQEGNVAGSTRGETKLLADRMGEQLLNAKSTQSEDAILRKSLKLDSKSISSFEECKDDEEMTMISSIPPTQVTTRVHESTRALRTTMLLTSSQRASRRGHHHYHPAALLEMMRKEEEKEQQEQTGREGYTYKVEDEEKVMLTPTKTQIGRMLAYTLFIMMVLCMLLSLGTKVVGPPRLPVGEYKIIEAQVGEHFFQYYDFYSGKDSAGSNGYNMYVSREVAEKDQIVKVVTELVDDSTMIEIYDDDGRQEVDWLLEDLQFLDEQKRKKEDEKRETAAAAENTKAAAMDKTKNNSTTTTSKKSSTNKHKSSIATTNKKKHITRNLQNVTSKLEAFNPDPVNNTNATTDNPTETFVILSSSPTKEGPRHSIRLEGRRRFNRGLFIIDLRHMPAGCGTWPAFWLTDEANWPVNGEIDIVEGVNYQNTAKTALHTTKECRMDDVPEGSKTGTWDTAVGIPDKKTGIPDMTFRFAEDCFVYDPHQWINQGCVATDLKLEGRSLGVPLNNNGGGVYALEWDPTNTHIRTWVFSPHGRVPKNLRDAMRTAMNADESTRVAPDTTMWGLPYGHFPIGDGTNCPAEHFRNMRLVINLAFCGSVAGTRYFMDCPKQLKKFKTCEKWVDSDPDELKEAYWKIRGVYVYEREWQKKWS